jgi:hypothetical protein
VGDGEHLDAPCKARRDVVDGLRKPDVAESFARLTLEPMIGSPADAARFFAEETNTVGQGDCRGAHQDGVRRAAGAITRGRQ